MEGPEENPRGGRRYGATVDSGFIRKRNRTERPRAIGGRSLFKKESVFRRPQGGQNQVREGTRRFRRALGGVMLCLEEETEGRGFQDKEEKWGARCPPGAPLRLIPVSFESGTARSARGLSEEGAF